MNQLGTAPPAIPAYAKILELVTSVWLPRALTTVVRLGALEALANGPLSVEEIARASRTHPDNLYRLLRALARNELLIESEGRTFALTDLSRPLLKDAPDSMRDMVLWLGAPWMNALWEKLGDAAKSDASAFEAVHGGNIYSFLKDHPEEGAIFHGAMVNFTKVVGDLIASAYDLSRFPTIVDVGGGTGELLGAVLNQYPKARGVLFDAKELESSAAETLARYNIADRCEFQHGDLRKDVPPDGDAYLMKNILHDLNDERAVQLLSRCRERMRPGGAVISVESVVPEKDGPYLYFLDLQLLLSGEGGKERTQTEYAALFSKAGLTLTKVVTTPAFLSVMVGQASESAS